MSSLCLPIVFVRHSFASLFEKNHPLIVQNQLAVILVARKQKEELPF